MAVRKTKIVCTLGPATDDPKVMEQLMRSGMNVARLNFSHGTHEEQQMRIDELKAAREKLGLPVALLLDTKGPEIRIGDMKDGGVQLKEGQTLTLTPEKIEGTAERVSIGYPDLADDLHVDDTVLFDDGLIVCKVKAIKGREIRLLVQNSAVLKSKKSLNIPGVNINMPYVSEADRRDLEFGVKNDVDFVAASFVRTPYDVMEIRKILEELGGRDTHIIAKIENGQGVENIDEIIKVSDGIMVARGDMGVEIALEELPNIQKLLIKKCYKAGKKVITATQLLDSMIRNPRPTRAETTDVANAIYDGTSAIMLSGETAIGKYPVQAVETMSRIAVSTEAHIDYKARFAKEANLSTPNVTDAISHATCTTAHDLGAAAIIAVTKGGNTARMISKFRPVCPIISPTTSEKIWRQLSLSWGVVPVKSEEKYTTDTLFDYAVELSVGTGIVQKGDIVVITGGIPVGVSGNTNTLKVHLVGDVLVQGSGVNELSVSGKLCVAKDEKELAKKFQDGDIIVMPKTSNLVIDILRHCSGIITEEEGVSSHGAVVGITLDIPVVTGAKGATKILKSGTTVTMDSARGLVYGGVVKLL